MLVQSRPAFLSTSADGLLTAKHNTSVTLCTSEYQLTEEERGQAGGRESVIVAVRSGHLLATAFHPELTDDTRWYACTHLPFVAHGSSREGDGPTRGLEQCPRQ